MSLPKIGWAEYPYARQNHNLSDQVKNDSDRFLPSFERANFAVDGDTWLRALGRQDFYHGVGYWMQMRTEIRPNPFFIINSRTIFYSGSSSEGYANPFGFYTLVGITGVWPEPILGSRIEVRIVDIERQNVGAGLLVQDREMNGGVVRISNEYYSLRLLGDSTGALLSGDDMANAELSLFSGWLGGGAAYWTAGKDQSNLPKNRDPYFYVTSSHHFFDDRLSYAVEIGQRNSQSAGLVNLAYTDEIGGLKLRSKVEYRVYNAGFGKDFVGRIQNQYVSYDQYDKPYTNAMSVMTKSDNDNVYALHLDIHYKFSPRWKAEALNEVGRFDYKDQLRDDVYYFYRAGLSHCPLSEREDCVTLFVSDKVLNESYSRPPRDVSATNAALFKKVNYVGLEGRFRF